MHDRKRIELIIERMAYKRACRVLETSGVTGYTVLPALAGFGGGNRWQRDTDMSASRDMVMIITIADEARTTAALESLEDLLGDHIGVVSVSDVEVLRPERF